MNKAILVIDMPEYCCNCSLNFWNRCGVLEAKEKLSGHIENPSTERLENCPLKPVPEEQLIWYDDERSDWERGYNNCLHELIGR